MTKSQYILNVYYILLTVETYEIIVFESSLSGRYLSSIHLQEVIFINYEK